MSGDAGPCYPRHRARFHLKTSQSKKSRASAKDSSSLFCLVLRAS